MAKDPKDGKLLYHLTAVENLESIIEEGLKPRAELDTFNDIADKEIIDYRTEKKLISFVPFHFHSGTPFAGQVQVENQGTEFIYLSVYRDIAKSRNFKVLTRHPLSEKKCALLDYQDGLDKIDWETMRKRDYTDKECRMVCMAECLSPEIVGFEDIFAIYCKSNAVKVKVQKLLQGKGFDDLKVNVRKGMFKTNYV